MMVGRVGVVALETDRVESRRSLTRVKDVSRSGPAAEEELASVKHVGPDYSHGGVMKYSCISADDHIDLRFLPKDIFTSRVPAALKDRVPRVVPTNNERYKPEDGMS